VHDFLISKKKACRGKHAQTYLGRVFEDEILDVDAPQALLFLTLFVIPQHG
jgi:hypothetical protein